MRFQVLHVISVGSCSVCLCVGDIYAIRSTTSQTICRCLPDFFLPDFFLPDFFLPDFFLPLLNPEGVPRSTQVLQRRHAFAGRNVPHLAPVPVPPVPTTSPRPRNDAAPVRKHCNAFDLRRSQIITKVQRTPRAARHDSPSALSASPRTCRSRFPTP